MRRINQAIRGIAVTCTGALTQLYHYLHNIYNYMHNLWNTPLVCLHCTSKNVCNDPRFIVICAKIPNKPTYIDTNLISGNE